MILNDSSDPDVFDALPRYRQVRVEIERAIANGVWLPGEALPNEHQLADRFATGIGTIRKAVGMLVGDNILLREQGRGTFVARHNPDRTRYYFFNVVARDGERRFPQRKVLSCTRGRADRNSAQQLGLKPRAPVVQTRIVQHLLGRPIMVEDITVCASRFAGLEISHYLDYGQTIYGFYQQRFGVNVIRSTERLSASIIQPEEQQILKLPDGCPVLELERIAYTFDDQPVEVRRSRVDTRDHQYLSELG